MRMSLASARKAQRIFERPPKIREDVTVDWRGTSKADELLRESSSEEKGAAIENVKICWISRSRKKDYQIIGKIILGLGDSG
jgi:hypothetical protein